MREETLKPAIASIVDRQLPPSLGLSVGRRHFIVLRWAAFPDGGTLADLDRDPTLLRLWPRARLTFYTWTSDQFSQYGSKPIPSTVRDATYVLDGILDNETELPIAEHTSDTAGYTDLVFGLFDLLGLQFSPRPRDLGDQKLYRIVSGISMSVRSSGVSSRPG